MKQLFFILLVLVSFQLSAQGETEWKEDKSIPCDSNSVWGVDVLGNVYISTKDLVQKYDSVAVLKFSQSQKSLGRISSIQPINTMKVIAFSEEQQIVCFFDNTLTQSEDCIELSTNFIQNATIVVTSAQPNKIWVYDQLNSKLYLLSIGETSQQQEIDNLRGILNSSQFSQLIERNNQLLLLNQNKGVYVMDMYGSLIESIEMANLLKVDADAINYYFITKDKLIIQHKKSNQQITLSLPADNVIDFIKRGSYFYFKTNDKIKKYTLIFK